MSAEIVKLSHPTPEFLEAHSVMSWPIWSKDVSSFPWYYESSETCYFLEGEVRVTPHGGTPLRMGKGDWVVFPAGMSCTWEILQAVRKHYRFA